MKDTEKSVWRGLFFFLSPRRRRPKKKTQWGFSPQHASSCVVFLRAFSLPFSTHYMHCGGKEANWTDHADRRSHNVFFFFLLPIVAVFPLEKKGGKLTWALFPCILFCPFLSLLFFFFLAGTFLILFKAQCLAPNTGAFRLYQSSFWSIRKSRERERERDRRTQRRM